MFTKKEIGEVTALGRSSLNIRNGDEVIKSFLDEIKPEIILEIGTYKGVGSLYMSQFCELLHTIDLRNGRVERQQRFAISEDNRPIRRELWNKFARENIVFHQIKDNEQKAEIVKDIPFDFCFIDGGHSSEDVKFDFNLVKHCGKVLFHDYDFSDRPKRDAVWNFVNTLPKEQLTVRDIFAYWEDK